MSCSTPEEAFSKFYSTFYSLFETYFPVKTVHENRNTDNTPYLTQGLKKSIKEKHRLARLANKWPLTYKKYYKNYRNQLTSLLRAAKQNYYKDQLTTNQGQAKCQWKTINYILGKHHTAQRHTDLTPKCEDIPNAFNNNFLRYSAQFDADQDNSHFQFLKESPNFS